MQLDHVALAFRDLVPALDVLVGELGGTVLQGAVLPGFRSVQVRVGDASRGMTVELLEPCRTEEFDFLERFLRDRGPGPHHLTFKTHDLAADLVHVRAAGLTPTGVLLDNPRWMEAFLTPAEAHGTVVQLAQGGLEFPTFADQLERARTDGPYGEPRCWPDPPPRGPVPSFLDRVVVSTPTLVAASDFYTGVLGGTPAGHGTGWRDVTWPGGGCVRLEEHAPGPAGIVRLEVTGPGPARTLILAGTPLLVHPA